MGRFREAPPAPGVRALEDHLHTRRPSAFRCVTHGHTGTTRGRILANGAQLTARFSPAAVPLRCRSEAVSGSAARQESTIPTLFGPAGVDKASSLNKPGGPTPGDTSASDTPQRRVTPSPAERRPCRGQGGRGRREVGGWWPDARSTESDHVTDAEHPFEERHIGDGQREGPHPRRRSPLTAWCSVADSPECSRPACSGGTSTVSPSSTAANCPTDPSRARACPRTGRRHVPQGQRVRRLPGRRPRAERTRPAHRVGLSPDAVGQMLVKGVSACRGPQRGAPYHCHEVRRGRPVRLVRPVLHSRVSAAV